MERHLCNWISPHINQAVRRGARHQRQRRAEGAYQRGGGSPGPGDPARLGSERADRRRGRERRLRLPARPCRGGVTAVGCLGPFSLFGGPIMITPMRIARPPRSPCRGRRRRGRPRPPRSGANLFQPEGGDPGGTGGITPTPGGRYRMPDGSFCRGDDACMRRLDSGNISVNSRRSRASGLARTSRGLGFPGRDDRSHVRGESGAVTWHPNPGRNGVESTRATHRGAGPHTGSRSVSPPRWRHRGGVP